MVTESRSYKPLGISSIYWLTFLRLYITGLRVYDVRPVRRVLRLRRRGFTLSSNVAVRSRFSDRYDHHDFGGFLANGSRILRVSWLRFSGVSVNLMYVFFETSLQLLMCEYSISEFSWVSMGLSGWALVFIFVAWWGIGFLGLLSGGVLALIGV